MRGLHLYRTLRTALVRFWQPAAVVGGSLLAVIGTTVTVGRLTLWIAPRLGWAPAATLAGAMVCALALRWARMTVEEQRP